MFDAEQHGIHWATAVAVAAGAYGMGCLSTGYYLTRARTGEDIRGFGSGSAGARNVGRRLGSCGFVVTLAGDLAKGGLAVWLAEMLTGSEGMGLLALLAVVAGHIWPAQLDFRGGKGVATSLAGLLVYDCWLTLIYLALLGAGYSLTRRATPGCLLAFLLLPLAGYFSEQTPAQVAGIAALAALVLAAHYRNILEGFGSLPETAASPGKL